MALFPWNITIHLDLLVDIHEMVGVQMVGIQPGYADVNQQLMN